MGMLSLAGDSEQNQTNVTGEISQALLDNKQSPDRPTVAGEVSALGEWLCGNHTQFIRWYRFEWQPYFGKSMANLSIDELEELRDQLRTIKEHATNTAALQLQIRNHYGRLNKEHADSVISNSSIKNPYTEKFYSTEADKRSGTRTADVSRLTDYELMAWVVEVAAAPVLIGPAYKSKTRIIALHTPAGTYVDGSLALDPKFVATFPNLTVVGKNAPSTSKIDTLTKVIPISGSMTTPDGETPVKVADFSPKFLMLESGRQNVLMLAAPQKATFETMTAITAKARMVCSGVVARVIEEKTGVNLIDGELLEVDAQKALAWVVGLQAQLMQPAQLMRFKEQVAAFGKVKVQDTVRSVTDMRTSDYAKLTVNEASLVLEKLGVGVAVVFDDKARRELWLKILPLERELGLDAMVSRANAGVPQTWTRGSEIELTAYLGKLQAQKANVALMGSGKTRRLGGQKGKVA